MTWAIIFDFNRTLYDPESRVLISGAVELLEQVRKHKCLLVSAGSGKQNISKLNIEKYFSKMYFVKQKTTTIFQAIVSDQELNKEKTLAIGDRVQSEILAANKAGIRTIWVKQGKFKAQRPASAHERPWKVCEDLKEVGQVIKHLTDT